MEVKLKSLELVNFKGKSVKVDLSNVTEIIGENGVGKTRVMDAFLWLLFGKDSKNQSGFIVKPLDENNNPLNHSENSVEAIMYVDRVERKLCKVHKEKWEKKHGQSESRLTGHTIDHYIDDLHKSATDYNSFVKNLMDEELFKLITSPKYFNSLNWKKRRNILFNLVDEVKDEDILAEFQKNGEGKYEKLQEFLQKGHTPEKFQESMKSDKQKIKERMDAIPPKIEELQRGKPEEKDFESLKESLNEKQEQLEEIEGLIQSKQKENEEAEKQIEAYWDEIKQHRQAIDEAKSNHFSETRKKLNDLDAKISEKSKHLESLQKQRDRLNEEIDTLNNDIYKKENDKQTLREEFFTERDKEFSFEDNEFVCPACEGSGKISKEVSVENINLSGKIKESKDKAVEQFNQKKSEKLEEIREKGKKANEELEKMRKEIEEKRKEVSTLENEEQTESDELEKLRKELKQAEEESNKEKEIKDEEVAPKAVERINELRKQLDNYTKPDTSEQWKQKKSIQSEIDNIKDELKEEKEIERVNNRIKELETEERNLGQQLSDIEQQEEAADEVINERVNRIESRVNSMFNETQFKMFEFQLNGGVNPTCQTLYKGKPYKNLSNGETIFTGVDIIKTLCNHYQVYAPVFIDNSESVTMPLYENLQSQVVGLVVKEGQKEMKVESVK